MGTTKIYTDEVVEKEADALIEWMSKDNSLFLKDFSFSRGYSYQTMQGWTKTNAKFAEAYARAKDKQESKLMHDGLYRQADSSFCKFTMHNVCRWSDKQTIVHEQIADAIPASARNNSGDLVNDSD